MSQGATEEIDLEVVGPWFLISLFAFLAFLGVSEEGMAYCCALPMTLMFLAFYWAGWVQQAPKRKNKAARARAARKRKREAAERKKAELKEKREQFAKWIKEKHPHYGVDFWDSLDPEYRAKWDEWRQEIKDKLAAEEKARKEADEEAARKLAAWLVAEAERKKAEAEAEAERKKAEAERKKAEAAEKKKQIKKDKEILRKALRGLQKRGLNKKIDNVSRHSIRSLLSVTERFDGIRKTGPLNQVKKSVLSNFELWTTQLAKIEGLNAELTKDSGFEDVVRIEQDPSINETQVKHPELKKKATNLRKRIAGKKLKLERVSKESAFSRPMLQTRDVPNATLNRKEKAWKLNDGSCIRCNKRSSGMAFYWDIFPDLQLVLICDECAAKEEFVHADAIEEESGEELADLFMRSVGTSEKKSKRK